MNRGRKKIHTATVLNYLLFLVIGIIMVYPFWYVVMYSLSVPSQSSLDHLYLWPAGFTLDNYRYAFSKKILFSGFFNSVFLTVVGTVVNMILTIMLAYPLSREKLDFIYRLKTSALIESSMTIGAVLAGAGEEAVRAVERVAGDVGLAFQIQDDILDVTSTLEVLGKPIHSDDKNQKTTYVTLEGLEKARKDVAEISARALETLSALECRNVFLEELIRMLITREK